MKRILLLSDSHGNVGRMLKAVEKEKPDMVCHMGDCYRDAETLRKAFPDLDIRAVIGNCDWVDESMEQVFEVEKLRFMMCHGHRYNVKSTLLSLHMRARELQADVVLFGHTHRVFYDFYAGTWYINPGSIGIPGPGIPPSYAVITVDGMEVELNTEYME